MKRLYSYGLIPLRNLVRVPGFGKAIFKNFEYTRSEKPDHDKKYPLDNRFKDKR